MPSIKQWEDQLNKTCLLFTRTLDASEIEVWKKFLEAEPPSAVTYAFENWQRNGRYFPRPHDILELIAVFKTDNQIQKRFIPCGKCDEGWVRVSQGRTAGGNPVDPKVGAVMRCQCFTTWATQRKGAA